MHTCHFPGCKKAVPPKMWGCKYHWFLIPPEMRSKLWGAYRPGQEIDKNPSEAYIWIAQEIQNWCINYLKQRDIQRESAQNSSRGAGS